MESKEYQNISNAIKKRLGYKKEEKIVKKIIKQKEDGSLDYKFKKYIRADFRIILKDFISILESKELENKPYYRKIKAYKNDFPKLFKTYGYELGSMLNKETILTPENNKSFFNFPLFFKESCRKCCFPRYANMSLDELESLLGSTLDLKHQRSLESRKDRKSLEDEIDVLLHTESTKMNLQNTLAEELTYYSLKDGEVERVTKECGAGYGFDLLALKDDNEVLISTKASVDNDGFLLSKKEHEVMVNSSILTNTKYYIYKFNFDDNNQVKSFNIYTYDRDNDVLVDVYDNSNTCGIEERIIKGKNGKPKISYLCIPRKTLKKILTLKNKSQE